MARKEVSFKVVFEIVAFFVLFNIKLIVNLLSLSILNNNTNRIFLERSKAGYQFHSGQTGDTSSCISSPCFD